MLAHPNSRRNPTVIILRLKGTPAPTISLPLATAHVRPVEALCRLALWTSILTSHIAARFLRSRDLGLERRSVGIDPLKLAEMSVQDTHDLAQLSHRLSVKFN